jgi:hypothetical protein
MPKTITRLYNSHAEARAVVRELEAAGVSHGDISILVSNADNAMTKRPSHSPIAISTARTTAPRARPPAAALVPRWAALRGCWPDWA